MRKTLNLNLRLYDSSDVFSITGENGLNSNMEIIDEKIKSIDTKITLITPPPDINKKVFTLADKYSDGWMPGAESYLNKSLSIFSGWPKTFRMPCTANTVYIITDSAPATGSHTVSITDENNIVKEIYIRRSKSITVKPKINGYLYFCNGNGSYPDETLEVVFSSDTNGFIIPDMFDDSSDSVKIQKCINIISVNGGTILLNRKYTLDSNIILPQTSDNICSFIIGTGIGAGIDMGDYRFVNQGWIESFGDCNTISYPRYTFKNLSITGSDYTCPPITNIAFENCVFTNFKNVLKGSNNSQCISFIDCKFFNISKACIDIADYFDVRFERCICERCGQFISAIPKEMGNKISIVGCTIEFNSADNPEIYITAGNSITINDNYFETEKGYSTVCIDISKFGRNDSPGVQGGLSICNNMVDLGQKNDWTTSYFVKLPTSDIKTGTWADMTLGVIQNNIVASPGHMILFEESTDELLPIVIGNNFAIRHSYPYSNPVLTFQTTTYQPKLMETTES